MIRLRSPLVLAPLLVNAAGPDPAAAARRPLDVSIVATEVTAADAKSGDQAAMVEPLRAASDAEARYWDPARTSAVLRIRIRKLSYKSAGKAVAGSLPFVGLLAGSNRNALKAEVELVDQASGKSLNKFKVEADDDTFFSAGDTALSVGKTALSFLPFGMLVSAAADVAQGAANHRSAAQEMLTRGAVMLSYRQVYGDKAYKGFAAQRKAAWAARKEADKAGQLAATAPAPATDAIQPATVTAARD